MTSKKCILFTIPTLNGGGAERVFTTYIRTLDPSKWDINLLLVQKTGIFLDQIPEYVTIFDLGKKRTRYGFIKFIKSIKSINPQLIVSTLNRMNILTLISSMFSPKNIICLYEPSMPSAQFKNRYLPRYYLWLMKILYGKADYIIAQTDEMKTEIEEYYNTPKKEIISTINPIDIEAIKYQLKSEVNPYNKNKINIVVSGRIREEKGQDFLLRAFAKVIDENPNFKLNILGEIGNIEFYNKLLSIIEEKNITQNVEFLGFETNPYSYYKYADLLILPSRWEGLPNVVLEALYLRTPVIVTDCIPFFRKLISEGENGFIVEFGKTSKMAKAILNYHKLKVETNYVPSVDINRLFLKMVNNE